MEVHESQLQQYLNSKVMHFCTITINIYTVKCQEISARKPNLLFSVQYIVGYQHIYVQYIILFAYVMNHVAFTMGNE